MECCFWSSSHNPGTENTLRPTLEPSGSGSATLRLVTTPNAPCSTVITTLQQLNIVYALSADAGADQDICVDAGSPVVVNVVGNNSDFILMNPINGLQMERVHLPMLPSSLLHIPLHKLI